MTSHRVCSDKLLDAVLQPWGPCCGTQCFGTHMNILGCRKYQTGNQCTKPLLHPLGRVVLTPDKLQIYMLMTVRGLMLLML